MLLLLDRFWCAHLLQCQAPLLCSFALQASARLPSCASCFIVSDQRDRGCWSLRQGLLNSIHRYRIKNAIYPAVLPNKGDKVFRKFCSCTQIVFTSLWNKDAAKNLNNRIGSSRPLGVPVPARPPSPDHPARPSSRTPCSLPPSAVQIKPLDWKAYWGRADGGAYATKCHRSGSVVLK